MNKFHSITRNESGYSLLLVFFTLAFVSVTSISLLSITTNSLTLSNHERANQSIFYIAEAGVTAEKQNIQTIIYKAYNSTRELHKNTPEENRDSIDFIKIYVDKIKTELTNNYPIVVKSFETQFGKQPEAKVEVDIKDNNPLEIIVTSTGYFNDAVTNNRTVSQTLNVDLNLKFLTTIDGEDSSGGNDHIPTLPQLAVQTTGNITVVDTAINGSIATSSGSVELNGGPTITGSIGVNNSQLIGPDWLIPQFKDKVVTPNISDIPLPTFPTDTYKALSTLSYPANLEVKLDDYNKTNIISEGKFVADSWIVNNYTLHMNQDTKFSDFIIGGNNTINLNIGNNTVNLLVDHFTIFQGHINIIGSGHLNIYVKDSLLINGSMNINGDPNQLTIYYAGNNDLSLSNGTNVSGSLHAQNANLTFTGGLNLSGNIITGGSKVNITGGANTGGQYIIAPHADITLSGGAHIKGILIGKSFKSDNGCSVTYAPGVVPPPFKPSPTPDYSDPDDLISEDYLIEI